MHAAQQHGHLVACRAGSASDGRQAFELDGLEAHASPSHASVSRYHILPISSPVRRRCTGVKDGCQQSH